jgi:hypothetical protein
MNIGIITARLVFDPARFYSFGGYITEAQINFLHVKNYLAKAVMLADSKIGEDIMKFYGQGDYILIEGEYIAVENGYQNTSLVIYATDVQPAHLIIKE